MRSAAGSAAQDERPHAFRILQRQFLRDHSAHRYSEHVRVFYAGCIQDGQGVGGHQRDRVRTGGHFTLADTAIVGGYGAVPVREHGPRAIPHARGIAEPHGWEDWISLALLVPINSCALILDESHVLV